MKLPEFGKHGRYALCIILVLVVFLGYELRLAQWQILEGEKYEQISLENRTDSIELDAARGPILDRNGKVLAGNRTAYNIVYNALYMDYAQRNATIIKVIDLLEERGEKWRDRLPILLDEEGQYRFAEDQESAVAALKSDLNLAEYATADDCIAELAEHYGCEGFSSVDTRNVASVRYGMTKDGYSRTNPYVIARDVSAETVGVLSQRSGELLGIEARVAVTRYYGQDGAMAPHVVGNVGQISQEEYNEKAEEGDTYHFMNNLSGYKLTDSLGKGGVEAAFEKELRGSRGRETIFTDETGAVKNTAVTTPPVEGDAVWLTLDTDLQRVANLSLEKNILGNTVARNCTSGAAVVLDVKTFGVLACSSYPTYDLNLFATDNDYVNALLEDKGNKKALLNRALQGRYVPGSVFKPMVALAALQEGVISAGTTYYCDKLFEYGEDMKLACTDTHGNVDLYGAISGSCNEYFANVGLDLKIARMDAYAEYFGLGTKTGVELPEEVGVMSNPQYYFETYGQQWTDGVSAQTAIGQANNLFTPIQLATYCATVANGGKRLQTHFLNKVTDYEGKKVISRYRGKELFDAGLSKNVLEIVREGMLQVANSGTARTVFGDYPVAVACKTGTAETSNDAELGGTEPNLSFICYAPAYDPQIAVAVVMEFGKDGNYAKNVAKDILDQYFGFYTWDENGSRYDSEGNLVDDAGEVLKTKEELDREKAAAEAAESAGPTPAPAPVQEGEEKPSGQEPAAGRDDIPTVPFTGSPAPTPAPGELPEENGDGSKDPEEDGPKEPESPYVI